METLWPWLAVAGLGALHGLNPATGWMLAAAWGLRSGGTMRPLRALAPLAMGHAGSVALVAGALALGMSLDRTLIQVAAGALFAIVLLAHLGGRLAAPAGNAGLALWSFMMSTAHGAGLMLAPALIPLCAGPAATVSLSGALLPALAAVALHMAAMLAVTGLVAAGACRFGAACLRRLHRK